MAQELGSEPKRIGYTNIKHSMMDSTAARLLGGSASSLLFDFRRAWELETRSGRRGGIKAVHFVFTGCHRVMNRKTFNAARDELISKGFIRVVNAKVGLYAESMDWESYSPTAQEARKMQRHAAAIQEQRNRTAAYRSVQKLVTTLSQASSDQETGTRVPNLSSDRKTDSDQCPKIGRSVVTVFSPDPITPLHPLPTTTNISPLIEEIPSGSGGGGDALLDSGAVVDSALAGEPPNGNGEAKPLGNSIEAICKRMQQKAENRSTEEIQRCEQRLQSLEGSIAAGRTPNNSNAPVHGFTAKWNAIDLNEDTAYDKLSAIGATAIGTGELWQCRQVRKALDKSGPIATYQALAAMIRAREPRDKAAKWIVSRADTEAKATREKINA